MNLLAEKILEYNYTTDLFGTVARTLQDYERANKEKPLDIPTRAMIQKLEHDLPLLAVRVKVLGSELNKEIEKRACPPGVKFKFIPTEENQFD